MVTVIRIVQLLYNKYDILFFCVIVSENSRKLCRY